MSTFHNIRLAIISASLLLPLTIGCGEIELPTRDETPTPEESAPPADNEEEDDKADNKGEEPEEKPDDGNQGNGSENTGDNKNEDDKPSGTAILTTDGHILVGNRLYLSLIEYRDIKGEDAKNVEATAKKYAEGTLKDWRVPTRNDVKILTDILTSDKQWYGGTPMAVLNHALEDSDLEDYDLLFLYEGSATTPTPIYYLSDAGATAYTYAAGATQPFINVKASKKYRLRLVKDK